MDLIVSVLEVIIHFDCFSSIFYEGDNFCDFLFGLLHTLSFLKRCVYSEKGKN